MSTQIAINPPVTKKPTIVLYSDVNTGISITGPEPLTFNQDAVLGAIYNILGVRRGERLWLPEFGSKLADILFDPIDEDTAFALKLGLINAIRAWEPRVSIDLSGTSVREDLDLQGYWATIAMRIKGLPDIDTYTLFLQRQHAT